MRKTITGREIYLHHTGRDKAVSGVRQPPKSSRVARKCETAVFLIWEYCNRKGVSPLSGGGQWEIDGLQFLDESNGVVFADIPVFSSFVDGRFVGRNDGNSSFVAHDSYHLGIIPAIGRPVIYLIGTGIEFEGSVTQSPVFQKRLADIRACHVVGLQIINDCLIVT